MHRSRGVDTCWVPVMAFSVLLLSISVIKYPGQSDLREKGPVSRKLWQQESEVAVPSHPQSGDGAECCAQPLFYILCSAGPQPMMVLLYRGLSTSGEFIETILHRHGQRLAVNNPLVCLEACCLGDSKFL